MYWILVGIYDVLGERRMDANFAYNIWARNSSLEEEKREDCHAR